jgi:hypothetical protein
MTATIATTELAPEVIKKLKNAKFDIFTNGWNNNKIAKSNKAGKGVFTIILHFAPAKNSGYEVCPMASAGCRAACLYTAGNGRYDTVKAGRIRRTVEWFETRDACKARIVSDIQKLVRLCEQYGLQPAVRLNGTSDIRWESVWPELFDMFPNVQFYDYTKDYNRLSYSHYLPSNYHLTFSRSECNDDIVLQILEDGRANVAVVFKGALPETWNGYPVYDADNDDLRFLDEYQGGAVAGLKAKGSARTDKSGFVILQ